MRQFILFFVVVLACNICEAQYPQWENMLTLPTAVAGATSAASAGYGVHLVGIYSGTVKHYYLGNDGTIVCSLSTLSVSGGLCPAVTNFGGKLRVTMNSGSNIVIYQSLDGGATWATLASYNPGVSIFDINAYSDAYGTHVVWSDQEGNSGSPTLGNIYYLRYDDAIYHSIVDFKEVTDITPQIQGLLPKVVVSTTKAHVIFSKSGSYV